MHPTITQMLIQAHRHELEVEAARVRLAVTVKAAGAQRRHTIFSPVAIGMAVILLAAATLVAACGGSSTAITHPSAPADGRLDVARVFESACAACHGPSGEGGLSGVPLNSFSTADRPLITGAIRRGVGGMPAVSDGMTDEQINALVDYVAGLR